MSLSANAATAPARAERLEFVEVRARPIVEAPPVVVASAPVAPTPASVPPAIPGRDQPGWSLWGDLEG